MDVQKINNFIIIDDDPISNLICNKYIIMAFPAASVSIFTDPVEGFEYICSHYNTEIQSKIILLLDIGMPVLNGWSILDQFEQLPEKTKELFKIFILTSSVDFEDMIKLRQYPFVFSYIEKPLDLKTISKHFNG